MGKQARCRTTGHTTAARAGVPEAQIMAQTGHRSMPVLHDYTGLAS